jgi:hypothetical protein
MRTRGFIRYEFWLVGALLIVVGAIVVSQVERVIHTRRERTARAYVARIAEYERAEQARTGRYSGTLPPALSRDEWFVVLNADSTGWGVGVQGPLHSSIDVLCGMFEGDPRHTALPGKSIPGEVACD